MIIRYSYRKTGYKNNNNVVNNKDIHAVYGNFACETRHFVLYSVGIVFDYSLSICSSCVPFAPGDARKIVLGSTNNPERLSLLLLCFLLISVEYFTP